MPVKSGDSRPIRLAHDDPILRLIGNSGVPPRVAVYRKGLATIRKVLSVNQGKYGFFRLAPRAMNLPVVGLGRVMTGHRVPLRAARQG